MDLKRVLVELTPMNVHSQPAEHNGCRLGFHLEVEPLADSQERLQHLHHRPRLLPCAPNGP